MRQFKEELSRYQLFWDELDQLDSRAWVLEPENPSPSCNHRRIVIGEGGRGGERGEGGRE